MRPRAVPAVVAAALTLSTWALGAAQPDPAQRPRGPDRDARPDGPALAKLVDAVAAGQLPGGDAWLTWKHHFFRAPGGKTYVPFTVTIEEGGEAFDRVAVYVRVVRPREITSAAAVYVPVPDFGDLNAHLGGVLDPRAVHPPIEGIIVEHLRIVESTRESSGPARVRTAVAIFPGRYEVYVALREHPAAAAVEPARRPKSAVLKQELIVPDFSGGLRLSSVVPIDRVDPLAAPLSADEQIARPYAFGTTELVPADDLRFDRTQSVSVMFFVYGVRLDGRGKPDVTVRYQVQQQIGAGWKVFGETAPQIFRGDTLPPGIDVRARRELPVFQSVALTSFPAGQYRLEIEVTDHRARETIREAVGFSIVERN